MCCRYARLLVGAVCVLLLGVFVGATAEKKPADPMLLQIYFKVSKERTTDFEKMYAKSYVPAMRKQKGYLHSNLLRIFPDKIAKEIEATTTEFNYTDGIGLRYRSKPAEVGGQQGARQSPIRSLWHGREVCVEGVRRGRHGSEQDGMTHAIPQVSEMTRI